MSQEVEQYDISDCIRQADSLLSEYVRVVQPMLVEIINRMPEQEHNKFTDAISNEIRMMNDHIARCFDDGRRVEEIKKELGKAEGHLQRVEFDVYKQMNWLLYDRTIGRIEKSRYEYKSGWAVLDWKDRYYELKNSITKVVEEARIADALGKKRELVLQKYKEGYDKYRELEELIMANNRDLKKIRLKNGGSVMVSALLMFVGSILGLIVKALLDWLS